ncbi:matrixin family metalloprotease [Rubrivivax gelatinosus]|nr:matrixin family metalloprotease [Rubrivivax gelatinosus]
MSQAKGKAFPSKLGLAKGDAGDDVALLQAYLQKFGYLRIPSLREEFVAARIHAKPPVGELGKFDASTHEALLRYQAFFGLPATGVLDQATVDEIRRPRCGFPDLPSDALAEFASQGSRWQKLNLTYGFSEFSPDLDSNQARGAVRAALDLWANVTSLTFTEVSATNNPDFIIRFVAGDHGDGSPFDGVGRVLAHAYYPPPAGGGLAGDAHFDESETWTVILPPPANTIDYVTVAAHEFGHSLGLAHSQIAGALMFPSYSGPHRFLHQDDIDGIRSIYPWGWDHVYRQVDPGSGIGGFDLRSPGDRVFAFDYEGSGRLDHLVFFRPGTGAVFILKNAGGTFLPVYSQVDPGAGIGGFDLRSPLDRAFAFDYAKTGKLDHLVFYRPGTGAIFILKNNGGSFAPVYSQVDPGGGIGGFDLRSPADQGFAFDYDGSGLLDHLVFFRPGTGAVFILKNAGGTFLPVYSQVDPGAGIGGFDLRSPLDRAFAFDYAKTGKLDHLVFYRPGTGSIFVLKNNGGSFAPVYSQVDPGGGIGGFDLRAPADQGFAFDYEGSGRLDHLIFFRPGTGAVFILKNAGGTFSPVYSQLDPGAGIGDYDLKAPADIGLAYDYKSSGRLDHLLFCRPGRGAIFILEREL